MPEAAGGDGAVAEVGGVNCNSKASLNSAPCNASGTGKANAPVAKASGAIKSKSSTSGAECARGQLEANGDRRKGRVDCAGLLMACVPPVGHWGAGSSVSRAAAIRLKAASDGQAQREAIEKEWR